MADETLNARLQSVLTELRPSSVLVIGESLAPIVETLSEAGEALTCLSSAEAARQLSALSIHDLALVQADAALAAPESDVLLARLRDVYARKVLVIVAPGLADGPWSRRSLIRLGFTPYGAATGAGDERLLLYQFDIATYKTTPDWLSPENWANPELWDKYRW